ncbi:MAG: hypothetical protein Q9203_001764 [Teloschistes exilis]
MAQSDLEAGTGPNITSQTVSASRAGDAKPQESGKISPRQIRYLLEQTTRRVSQKMVNRFRKKGEKDSQDQTHAVRLTNFSPNDEPHVLDTAKVTDRTSASLLIDDASRSSRSSDVNLNDTLFHGEIDTGTDISGSNSGGQQAPQVQIQDLQPQVQDPQAQVPEWSKFDTLPSGYRQKVGQMTDADIKAEKEDRKKIRGKWRLFEEYGYIEDPWKPLWEQRREKGLHRWPCSEDDRKAFQLAIIDALNSSPFHVKWIRRADMSQILKHHISAVRISIYIINVSYKHNFPKLNEFEDFDRAWCTPISAAGVEMRHKRQTIEIDFGRSPFLAVGDLNLKNLTRIGQLRIQWTPYWDEHLELETTWTKNIFKLYWFDPILARHLYAKSLYFLSPHCALQLIG